MARNRGRKEALGAALAQVIGQELTAFHEELEKSSPAIRIELQRLLGNAGARLREGTADPEVLLDVLIDTYSQARAADRRSILAIAAARLCAMAGKASKDHEAPEAAMVRAIGGSFRSLVLDGTVQQQFVSAFAVELGRVSARDLALLHEPVVVPLIRALIVVLRVGAPTTRDSAVEGLGALLKCHPNDSDKELPFEKQPLIAGDPDDPSRAGAQYVARVSRRRLMVLAVARHNAAHAEFLAILREPIAHVIASIRKSAAPERRSDELMTALYARADLLRTLPAMLRQGSVELSEVTRLLRTSARLPPMREDDGEAVAVAFARFQESVFRTIDVLLKRHPVGSDFDNALAEAVNAIQHTLVGPAGACNAEVRSTVAILQAAIRLIENDSGASATKAALLPLFSSFRHRPTPWLNLGIAEGCYRGLPFLLSNTAHEDLVRPALAALFKHLRRHHDFDDFVETHRQLIATACFRRILIRRLELSADVQSSDPDMDKPLEEADTEQDVRTLLLTPDTQHVLDVFQGRNPDVAMPPRVASRGVAETLISGMAFESDLLPRSAALFRRWKEFPAVQRVLLTRILAAQLRASSQDSREVARYALLTRLYAKLPTVSLSESERLGYVWDLLAALPAEAAGAADADLQDFVNHCGRRNRSARKRSSVEDLPGHVLAMISDAPSSGIADAIAREMDLNLRHERQTNPEFDFGTLLYQVTLRGPDKSVFDHLLPRIPNEDDRKLVRLFAKHVETVARNPKLGTGDRFSMTPLLVHVRELLNDPEKARSSTVQKLVAALELYRQLAEDTPGVWTAIDDNDEGGGFGLLFARLDDLARDPHDSAPAHPDAPGRRKPLVEAYSELAAQLKRDVAHYLELAVGDFHARATALRSARSAVRDIERALPNHEGLQPPERIMLIALMQHLRDHFERTIRWFCEEPLRCKEAGDEARFWVSFVCKPEDRPQLPTATASGWLGAAASLAEGDRDEALRSQTQVPFGAREIEQLRLSAGAEPPPFPEQRERFEAFYVDWMSAELRVDALRRQLRSRWSKPFAWGHDFITNQLSIALLVLIPCGFAAWLHIAGQEAWEGIGFFVLAFAAVVCGPLAFMPKTRARIMRILMWEPFGRRAMPVLVTTPERSHRLRSVLPRLARLIAVPMGLIVELEHSYEFSLHASTWVLLLLMLLAYLTTRFFVGREIVDVDGRRSVNEPKATLRARSRQVMAVALAYSFGFAVLFATIFAPSHLRQARLQTAAQSSQTTTAPPSTPLPPATRQSAFFRWIDRAYGPIDAHVAGHDYPIFAGVLPRDVPFDIGRIVSSFGLTIPTGLTPHLSFTFYPTLILTWTALGLFVGVFLEGFVKGERLRGPLKEPKE